MNHPEESWGPLLWIAGCLLAGGLLLAIYINQLAVQTALLP